jgi:hypothetical protein
MMRKRLILGSTVALCLSLSVAASQAATAHKRRQHVPVLPANCSDTAPCHFHNGRYRLGSKTELPGLRLTLPRGWSSNENWQGGLNLTPPGHPNDALFVWSDMVAVKSTGPGHGTPLSSVGTTPTALLSWLTTNPDFMVVSPPKATKIARRIPATNAHHGSLDIGGLRRSLGFKSIGYPEELQLSLAAFKRGTQEHTLFVGLDATNDGDMAALRAATHSVIASFWLPKTVTPG